MSEQMPQDQVGQTPGHTPVDPSTLTTEHGYTPDYPVYPGEEGRVLDPDQALAMADASKGAELEKVNRQKSAEIQLDVADRSVGSLTQRKWLKGAQAELDQAKVHKDEAHELAIGAAKEYVKNVKMTEDLNNQLEQIKK